MVFGVTCYHWTTELHTQNPGFLNVKAAIRSHQETVFNPRSNFTEITKNCSADLLFSFQQRNAGCGSLLLWLMC